MTGIRYLVVTVQGGAGIHKRLSVEGVAKIDVAAYLSSDLNAIMQEGQETGREGLEPRPVDASCEAPGPPSGSINRNPLEFVLLCKRDAGGQDGIFKREN